MSVLMIGNEDNHFCPLRISTSKACPRRRLVPFAYQVGGHRSPVRADEAVLADAYQRPSKRIKKISKPRITWPSLRIIAVESSNSPYDIREFDTLTTS